MKIGFFDLFDARLIGDPTQYGLPIGRGTETEFLWTNAPSDGQLLIGSTGNPPALSTLTAGSGISIVNGSASITISATGGSSIIGTPTENGLAIGQGADTTLSWTDAPIDGQLLIGSTGSAPTLSTLTAGSGITITNGSGSISISSNAAGISWVDATDSSISMDTNRGYITNRGGGVTYSLPSTASLGDILHVVGKNGDWSITQATGQIIYMGTSSSTLGSGGSISSSHEGDCVTLRCITPGSLTSWRIVNSIGNVSFV